MGWIALNVDSSSAITILDHAGFGALLRSQGGILLLVLVDHWVSQIFYMLRLWLLLCGLDLCWEEGFQRVNYFTYSLETIWLINEVNTYFHKHENEIALVRDYLKRE